MTGGIDTRPASSPGRRDMGRVRAARLVLGTFSLLCSLTALSSSPGDGRPRALPLPALHTGSGWRTAPALLIARTPVLSLRGGRKADHLPRAFKRALRRHTKSRLITQRSRRLQKRKPVRDENGTLVRQPRLALKEPVHEEDPEPRWSKAFDQEPPDFSLLLEDWSRGHRPEDCPTGADGKKKGPHWDHSLPEFRDLPATQERLWHACGCYDLMVMDNPETVGLSPGDGWGGARTDGAYSPFYLDRALEEIEAGADVNLGQPADRYMTPLHYAARNGSADAVRAMLAAGANISAVTLHPPFGWTPLHTAAYSGMMDAVEVLLENGAELMPWDSFGWLPLHWAAYGGHADICAKLIEKGTPIDIPSQDFGWSALHSAASRGFIEVCQSLITLGADFTLHDSEGKDPHALAVGLGLQDCSAALRTMAHNLNLTRFECLATDIPGVGECLLAVRGPVTGNVYAFEPSNVTGKHVFMGRFDAETKTFDADAKEKFVRGEEEGSECEDEEAAGPEWAEEGEEGEWEQLDTVLQEMRVDGETLLKEVGGPELYSSEPPHRYVGLLRKDGGVDRAVPLDRLFDYPEWVPETARGNKPGFVIGALNGSIEAAREYNAKIMAGSWAAMANYGPNKIDWEGPVNEADEQGARDRPGRHRMFGADDETPIPGGGADRGQTRPGEESTKMLREGEEQGPVRRKKESRAYVKGWVEQIEDMQWDIKQRERLREHKFVAVGDSVLKIDKSVHPLFRSGACTCPHCVDMRLGATGIVCHCEHCYVQGYWDSKSLF